MAAADGGGEFSTKIRRVSGVRLRGSSSSCSLPISRVNYHTSLLNSFSFNYYFIAMTPSSLEFCS